MHGYSFRILYILHLLVTLDFRWCLILLLFIFQNSSDSGALVASLRLIPSPYSLFFADPSTLRSSSPTSFIFLLTLFLSPHDFPLSLFSLRISPQSPPPTSFILFHALFPLPHNLTFLLLSLLIPPQSATFPKAIHLPPIPFNYLAISQLPDTFFFPSLIHSVCIWDFLHRPDSFNHSARPSSLCRHLPKSYISLSGVPNLPSLYSSLLMPPSTGGSVYLRLLVHHNFVSHHSPHLSWPDSLHILFPITKISPHSPVIVDVYQHFQCTLLLLLIIYKPNLASTWILLSFYYYTIEHGRAQASSLAWPLIFSWLPARF